MAVPLLMNSIFQPHLSHLHAKNFRGTVLRVCLAPISYNRGRVLVKRGAAATKSVILGVDHPRLPLSFLSLQHFNPFWMVSFLVTHLRHL